MIKLLSELNGEDRLIISSLILGLAGVALGALIGTPHVFGFTALAVLGLLVAGWLLTQGPRLAWLLLFGLVTGVLELWADWVHVVYLGSLVYTDYFGFKLLASPSYMPIGWLVTAAQFGYLALRLSEHRPKWIAVTVVTLLGMTVPPWYEQFAGSAGAWQYTTTGPMLSHTPVWIILTYGGCMFAVATVALACYRPGFWSRAILGGIFAAAGIMFSGVFWFWVLGHQ